MHDILTDLLRIHKQASPALHRVARQLVDAHELMDSDSLAEVIIRVKRRPRKAYSESLHATSG